MAKIAGVVGNDLASFLDPQDFPVLSPDAVFPVIGFIAFQGLTHRLLHPREVFLDYQVRPF